MELAGNFFLCMTPSSCRTSDGRAGVLFALREPSPSPTFPSGLSAIWVGDKALDFVREHGADLRPGRGLRLAVNRITARDGEVRARVVSCDLLPLPPSWQRPNPQQPTQALPA